MTNMPVCAKAAVNFADLLRGEGIPSKFKSPTNIIVETKNSKYDYISVDIDPNFGANMSTDKPWGQLALFKIGTDGEREWVYCPQMGYDVNGEDRQWYNMDEDDIGLLIQVMLFIRYDGN
jgi:hypothetical protein